MGNIDLRDILSLGVALMAIAALLPIAISNQFLAVSIDIALGAAIALIAITIYKVIHIEKKENDK